MIDALYGIDVGLFRFFNRTIANPVFDLLMPFLTDLNKQPFALLFVAAVLIAMAVKGGERGRWAALILILTIVISDQLNSSVIKYFVGRVRPCHVLSDVHLLVSCGSGFSFPSSHAVNNFAAAVVLSSFYRKWTWMFMAFASIVAFSRVSVGVHYPSDIVAGAVLGASIGGFVFFIYQYSTQRWRERKLSGESAHDPLG